MRRYRLSLLLLTVSTVFSGFAQVMPEPLTAGVPFYLQPGAQQALPLESQLLKLKAARGIATFELDPERSPVRIAETRPRFLVKLAAVPNQDTMDQLIILDTVNGKRTARLTVERGFAQPMVGKQIEFEYKKFGQSSYLIRPKAPLRPGEYCFGFGISSMGYFFGIEPDAVDSAEDKAPPVTETSKTDDPNQDRLKKLDALLAKGLIEKTDYDTRKEEILHPPAAKPVTVEDRLRKLDDLLKKGLIAKPEYDKKRTEILSEM
jgi:hypothetical protein